MNNEVEQLDENEIITARKEKLAQLREKNAAYPNDFRIDSFAADLVKQYDALDKEELAEKKIVVNIAGRVMTRRLMGKASFTHVQDMTGKMQVYLRNADLPEGRYEEFKKWDLGDIIGVSGYVFKTKTGELSVHADDVKLLTKSLRPLPDKFHGLSDKESCYRQRYLDLIANEQTRKNFLIRSQVVEGIRRFLTERRFLEVETPMMQLMPGGAAAKPFATYHNALDLPLYLRVAPELNLKRLVVGGFDRVFEINRNFRNEGLSAQHNPEFTMLEFYQAYANYHDLMDLTEELLRTLTEDILQTQQVDYQGHVFDFAKPFVRIGLRDSILQYNPKITAAQLDDIEQAKQLAEQLNIPLKETYGLGKIQLEIFEKTVEEKLMDPTFITEYPAEVSPLARRNDANSFITDRFEFFVGGREIANGFSELNDPEDQAERFRQQVREKAGGDEEAMPYDEDYILALEHGLPPTAGEGIGIDRLVMLFTDSPSIRDVILFPYMRPVNSEKSGENSEKHKKNSKNFSS